MKKKSFFCQEKNSDFITHTHVSSKFNLKNNNNNILKWNLKSYILFFII